MIIITATWNAEAGKEVELSKCLQKMVDAVRKNESQCIQYTLHQGLEDKSLFHFYERYKDKEAIEFHKNTPHFKKLIAETESLIAKPVQVSFYEVIK
ncbi:MAG: antibiotic biosynthesis monooxygenase [Deltaproteobacteria bacterium]|nr:antibiotic biosynthesis monooxygenase [Deltaproteobacteria bacterium]